MDLAIADMHLAGIPVEFELCYEDVVTPPPRPPPITFLLPRSSFFFAISKVALDSFRPYVADFGSEPNVWLQYKGNPVAWHYPAGVIADLALAAGGALPLLMVVRITSTLPPPQVMRANSKKDQLCLAAQLCKQTSAVMFGEVKPILNLHPSLASEVSEFALRLTPGKTNRDSFQEGWKSVLQNGGQILRYPVKYHRPGKGSVVLPVEGTLASSPNFSLGDALDCIDRVSGESWKAGKGSLLVNGLQLSPQTPFTWVFQNFTAADGSLHFIFLSS